MPPEPAIPPREVANLARVTAAPYSNGSMK